MKIDRRGKQVTYDGVRIAYFDETESIKYEGIAVEVKAEVEAFMQEWENKRNQ